VKRWVQLVEKRAGLPVTGKLHVYRHTFGSHLAMAGVPARTIQELARHESLNTTMRYMHLSPGAKDEGIAMLTRSRDAGGKPVAMSGNGLATGPGKLTKWRKTSRLVVEAPGIELSTKRFCKLATMRVFRSIRREFRVLLRVWRAPWSPRQSALFNRRRGEILETTPRRARRAGCRASKGPAPLTTYQTGLPDRGKEDSRCERASKRPTNGPPRRG
jgi:hypothetical protein